MENEVTDIIYKLSNISFSSQNFATKKLIVDNGRPTPKLLTLKTIDKKSGITRTFNSELYIKHPWLCGSEYFTKLFCWPCLLFLNKENVWGDCKKGFADLGNLHKAITRHEFSENHIKAWILLKSFGKTQIDMELSTQLKLDIERHNEKVKNNREILKRLIATTILLAKQDTSFRGHNEKSNSINGKLCRILIHNGRI